MNLNSISHVIAGAVAFAPMAASAAVVYQEVGGVVAFEAEGYSSKSAPYVQDSNSFEWVLKNSADAGSIPDASGGSYMQVLPDVGVNHNNATTGNINYLYAGPSISYDFLISTEGQYTFFVRGAAGAGLANSEVINAKVFRIDEAGNVLEEIGAKEGAGVTTMSTTQTFPTDNWNVIFTPPTLENGEYYRLTIYMRHDGAAIDKIAGLINPVATIPSGEGPEVSPPVPEPTAAGLIGLAALGLARRRRA